jgi:hypothetical protein
MVYDAALTGLHLAWGGSTRSRCVAQIRQTCLLLLDALSVNLAWVSAPRESHALPVESLASPTRLETPSLSRITFELKTVVAVIACACLAAFGVVAFSDTAKATVVVGTAGEFIPVQGRLVSTAVPTGVPLKAPLAPSTPQTVQVTGAAGVPSSNVSAVLLTLTATDPTVAGELSAGASSSTLSGVMHYNVGSGSVTSNSGVVSVSTSGQIVIEATSTTNVNVDVQGYYTMGNGVAAAGGYTPVPEARIVDTVNGFGLPATTIGSGQTVSVQATGNGGVPTGSQAVFINFQVDNTNSTAGYINPYATSTTSRPSVALNFPGVPYTSIGAIVPLDASGKFDLYLSAGNTVNLMADVEGYFTAGSTNGTFTSAVGNIFDTRIAPHVAAKPGQTITVPVAGTNGLPATSDGFSSAVVNVTEIDGGTSGGYARAYADGTTEPAGVATVTFGGGTHTDLATIPVGLDGAIEVHNVSADTVNYVVDIEGFYQNTSSTMCANDTDTIQGEAASTSATVGASDDSPVLSGVLTNTLNNEVEGSIYLVDSSGNPVDGSPTATADIDSGSPLTFHVPAEDLTVGATYTWWVHADQNDGCAAQATSARHDFTVGAAATPQPPAASTLEVTGSALTTESAQAGSQDCAGSPCALNSGAIALGSDGSTNHVSAIKADLSGLPAGSTIVSAMLKLTPSSCFGTSCTNGTLDVAQSPVTVTPEATGFDLASTATPAGLTFSELNSSNSYDITSIVQDWYDGGGSNNFGAVLSEVNPGSGATGESFYGPGSATSPASISIAYVLPSIPGVVQNLTMTPGDSGVIASWADPSSTGWYDTSGSTGGITSYTATLLNASGSVLAVKTVARPIAVFTGLTNGTSYSVTVAATNPIGVGPTVQSSMVQPSAVQNGSAAYVTAVQDLVTAEGALSTGNAASTADATASDSDASTVQSALSMLATGYESENAQAMLADQTEVGDTTTLADTLVVQAGSTVTVYTTVNDNYTTRDMSTGTEVDQAGGSIDYGAFEFQTSGSTIKFSMGADEDSLLGPITERSADTALDAASRTALGSVSAPTSTGYTGGSDVSLSGVANWAKANWHGGTNGFYPDCTDFVSRALHFGGGQPEIGPLILPGTPHINSDPNVWYDVRAFGKNVYYSHTWGQAPYNANYEISHGGYVQTSRIGVKLGWIVYGALYGGGWSKIDHAGIVTAVVKNAAGNVINVYVAQHTDPYLYDPVYKIAHFHSWLGSYSTAQIWYVDPTGV